MSLAEPARGHDVVPILTYHSLDESDSVISMPPWVFAEQMQSLAERGFVGVRVDELLDYRSGRGELPTRPVVLTFDDAFANFEEHAVPVLARLGFRATIYAIPGLTGATNRWPGQIGGIPPMKLMSWAGLQQLADLNFEIGAHTMTHRRLDALDSNEVRDEVVRSRDTLEDRLGRRIRTFAYPFGTIGSARGIVRDTFDGACGTRLDFCAPADDPHALPRLDMYYFRHRAAFRLLDRPSGRTYVRLRRMGNHVRQSLSAVVPSLRT